jgi:hypothetical protein
MMTDTDVYVFQRLKSDAAAALQKARDQKSIQHNQVKGRFREILIQDLIIPWLPPFVTIGSGVVINGITKTKFDGIQYDIIVTDNHIMPSILINQQISEGVYLTNSVLAQIEVKSVVNKREINDFCIKSSASVEKGFVKKGNESHIGKYFNNIDAPYNFFVGLESDINSIESEGKRLNDAVIKNNAVLKVQGICIPDLGFWAMQDATNPRLKRYKSSIPSENLAAFVALMTNSIMEAHLKRFGIDPERSVAAGIGLFCPIGEEMFADI